MTFPASDMRQELETLFDEQLRTGTDLLATLSDEREALQKRDIDVMAETGEAKVSLLVKLEQLETERKHMLELAGAPQQGDALDRYLDSLGETDGLTVRWQRFLGLVEECRHLNEANGRLVALQRDRVEQALIILRQSDGAATYGPDGSRGAQGRRNILASA